LQEFTEKLLFRPNATGNVSVCLAYPNVYRVAMGNLGFQAVYRLLATQPGLVCERAFLPPADHDARGLRSLEGGRGIAEFDVIAFSLSFESDYSNIVRMLDAAGIPARAADRAASGRVWPLLIAGGPATFLNPEPVAPFFDAFLIGEGEEMIPEAFADIGPYGSVDRSEILSSIARTEGAYLPDRYEPEYVDGDLVALHGPDGNDAAERVRRRYVANLDDAPVYTNVVAPDAVFGDYYLVEASRGCEWGCRFCAAGFMYRPVRHRSAESVTADALAGLKVSNTIGLVGAEMASHPGIAATCERVAAQGGRVSPSSLKADVVSPRLAHALGTSGTQSVTIAPEAGSERMRRVINKNLTEAEILRATDLMVGDGVESLKLYFMCALPTETDEDVEGIVDLTVKIRELLVGHGRKRGRVGRIKVSVNPFVPKPWTPFQWDAMVPVGDAQKRLARLRKMIGRVPNTQFESESPREAYLQTLLSRGDRRVAAIVEALARDERGWWPVLQSARRGELEGVDVDPDRFVTREYDEDTLFPWDFIDHHIEKSYLWLERRRAHSERETEPCDVATCHTCGAC
jgi:radical SAM superfamily enzyme YgiQ (UPF0313 family)